MVAFSKSGLWPQAKSTHNVRVLSPATIDPLPWGGPYLTTTLGPSVSLIAAYKESSKKKMILL